jgi:6-pyruvoyltetrahydropterin/6-carboxytetrahydropterin synthase
MHVTLTKTFRFEAAHWLPTFPDGHKCRRLHGHSFHADVIVTGQADPARGYLIDYNDITAAIQPIQNQLDHRLLNEVDGLTNPTAENIAKWTYDRLKPTLPQLTAVRIRETCTTEAEYRGPETSPNNPT